MFRDFVLMVLLPLLFICGGLYLLVSWECASFGRATQRATAMYGLSCYARNDAKEMVPYQFIYGTAVEARIK